MPAPITAAEILDIRTRLGLTPDEIALELLMPREEYDAKERGARRMTAAEAYMVRFLVIERGYEEALARSGLPTCAWRERHARNAPRASAGATIEEAAAHDERAEEHAESCATCQARERWVEEHCPPPPPFPAPAWARMMIWGEERPAWMRPALAAALVFAALSALHAVWVLATRWRSPADLLVALGAIAMSAAAGAFAGLVYHFAARPLLRVPAVGRYLAGLVGAAGYVGGVMVLLTATGVQDFMNLGGFVIALISVVPLGLVVGHNLPRARERDA